MVVVSEIWNQSCETLTRISLEFCGVWRQTVPCEGHFVPTNLTILQTIQAIHAVHAVHAIQAVHTTVAVCDVGHFDLVTRHAVVRNCDILGWRVTFGWVVSCTS